MTHFTIAAARLFDGSGMRGPAWVEIADGHVVAVHDGRPEAPATVQLAEDVVLAPGFIDVQVNGGGGVLLNDEPTLAGIAAIATAHRRFGTTALLPTLITDDPARMEALFGVAAAAMALPGIAGFHLEGPHLNPARRGIHPAERIHPPSARDLALLCAFGRAGRSQVTLAPETVDPALIRRLAESGLRVSAGHSDATAGDLQRAADHGLTGVTHLFNAMSQITPRAPGAVGAALADDRLYAGIIADGLHVDPLNLRLAFRAKGPERLMLVTDAMSSVGAASDHFRLHGRLIRLAGGRLTDDAGTLAGAHLGMNEAVRNAVAMMGATLAEALTMASLTPARFLGLDGERGRIAKGFRADLVALDAAFGVTATWIGGV